MNADCQTAEDALFHVKRTLQRPCVEETWKRRKILPKNMTALITPPMGKA